MPRAGLVLPEAVPLTIGRKLVRVGFEMKRAFVLLAGAALLIGAIVFFFARKDSTRPAIAVPAQVAIPQKAAGSSSKQSWTYPPPIDTRVEDFFSPKTDPGKLALNRYYQKHPEVVLLKEHVSEMRTKLYRRQVELQGELPPEEYAKMISPLTPDEVILEDQMLVPAIIMGSMGIKTPIGTETIGSISTDLLNNTDYLHLVRPGFAALVRERFNDAKTAEKIENSKNLFEFGMLMSPYVDQLISQPGEELTDAQMEAYEFRLERRLLKAMEELEWNYTRSFTEDIPR
jgi:hypothetical protein